MYDIWQVSRHELILLWRGRLLSFVAGFMLLLGVWEASAIHEAPYGAWGTFTFTTLLMTLVLVFMTGDQIIRDRERRVESVVLSTPLSTRDYVIGKYLSALITLLALSLVNLVAAVFTDALDTWRNPPAILGHSWYPALGPQPYMWAWLLLVTIPLIFGAALMLAGITVARGQRALAYAVTLLLWLGPAFLGGPQPLGTWPDLLDVVGLHLTLPFTSVPAAMAIAERTFGGHPDAATAALVVHLSQQGLPPAYPAIFFWNRLFFMLLALLLLWGTAHAVAAARRGNG